jgi:hypothetical protein
MYHVPVARSHDRHLVLAVSTECRHCPERPVVYSKVGGSGDAGGYCLRPTNEAGEGGDVAWRRGKRRGWPQELEERQLMYSTGSIWR